MTTAAKTERPNMVHADGPRQSRATDRGPLAHHETFSDELTQAGIKNVDDESPGTAHEWRTGCRSGEEFAPLLFRSRSTNEDLQ